MVDEAGSDGCEGVMMRHSCSISLYVCIAIVFLSASSLHAQNDRFSSLLEEGKNEIKAAEQVPLGDVQEDDSIQAFTHYSKAVRILEESVALRPNSQEAHYFLGYAYDRSISNRSPGSWLHTTTLETTRRISEQFQKVITINPRYDGEILVLDPYSKLSSTWGSLAIAYAVRGDIDSARWAFREGRRLQGFPDLLLEYCRNILSSCQENAILFVNGDNDTFPMWYLQCVDGYRADVTVVNIALSTVPWHLRSLTQQYPFGPNNLKIGYNSAMIDTLGPHVITAPLRVTIPIPEDAAERFGIPSAIVKKQSPMSWRVSGTTEGSDRWISAQDQIVIDVVKANLVERPLYFSVTSSRDDWAGLNAFVRNEGFAYRIVPVKLGNSDSDDPISYQAVTACLMHSPGKLNADIPLCGFQYDAVTNPTAANLMKMWSGNLITYQTKYNQLARYELDANHSSNSALAVIDRFEEVLPLSLPMPYPLSAEFADLCNTAGDSKKATAYAEMTLRTIDAYEDDPTSNPYADNYPPKYIQARVYILMGDYEAAIEKYQIIQRDYPDDLRLRLEIENLRVDKFLARNDTASAITELKTIIADYGRRKDSKFQGNLESLKARLAQLMSAQATESKRSGRAR